MEGIDKNTFKQIFYDYWDTFIKFNPRFDSPYYIETVQKMLDCGDPEKMGFVQYRCCYCGEIRRIAFTCKSCFCLSCAKVYTDRWSDFIARRLLPGVTYRHVVLTALPQVWQWHVVGVDISSQIRYHQGVLIVWGIAGWTTIHWNHGKSKNTRGWDTAIGTSIAAVLVTIPTGSKISSLTPSRRLNLREYLRSYAHNAAAASVVTPLNR